MQVRRFLILILLFCGLVGLNAQVHTVRNLLNVYDVGVWVSNPDEIMPVADVDLLNEKIKAFELRSSREIVVVALESIGGKDSDLFADQLFKKWKVGKTELKNGILILLVADQGTVSFITGSGIEKQLTDAMCKQIFQEWMLPYFQKNNFSKALVEGAEGVIQFFNTGKYQAPPEPDVIDLFSDEDVLQPVDPDDKVANAEDEISVTDNEMYGILFAMFMIPAVIGVLTVWYLTESKSDPNEKIKTLNKASFWTSVILVICCAGIVGVIAVYAFRYFYIQKLEKGLSMPYSGTSRPQPTVSQRSSQATNTRPAAKPSQVTPSSVQQSKPEPISKEERARLKLLEKERERERQREKEREERRKLGRRSSW